MADAQKPPRPKVALCLAFPFAARGIALALADLWPYWGGASFWLFFVFGVVPELAHESGFTGRRKKARGRARAPSDGEAKRGGLARGVLVAGRVASGVRRNLRCALLLFCASLGACRGV